MESGSVMMAVFAVSGSVIFIASQLHKRLVSDFMKKIEFELRGSGTRKCQGKKKVRFADEVMMEEPSSNSINLEKLQDESDEDDYHHHYVKFYASQRTDISDSQEQR